MNLQSWILLFLILGLCSYIIYTRFIKGEGACADCAQAKNCNSKHCEVNENKKSCPYCD